MTTTQNTQTYSSKSTAIRGAKRAGLSAYTIEEQNGRFAVVVPAPVVPAPVAKPAKERKPRVGPSYKELAREHSSPSEVTGPVAFVHSWLADNGRNVTRKQAIASLVSKGVNYSTARTQYQRWFEATREAAAAAVADAE
jgi:hypothetical protein